MVPILHLLKVWMFSWLENRVKAAIATLLVRSWQPKEEEEEGCGWLLSRL